MDDEYVIDGEPLFIDNTGIKQQLSNGTELCVARPKAACIAVQIIGSLKPHSVVHINTDGKMCTTLALTSATAAALAHMLYKIAALDLDIDTATANAKPEVPISGEQH